MDGICDPAVEAAVQRRCDRTNRRSAVGRVALPPLRWKRPIGSLSGCAALFLVATLQGVIVSVYDCTRSLLVAMLMHLTIVFGSLVLIPVTVRDPGDV
jgi:membrane protease YdiL (CAAX protease family)